jgi:uncharacterized membrane protein YjdF
MIKYLHYFNKKRRLKIPQYYFTLANIAIYLAFAGEFYLELYYNVIHYDKILHFFVSMYLVVVTYFLMGKKAKFRSIFAVLIVLGLGAVYELLEFGVDSISGTTIMQGVVIEVHELMGGLKDTMFDLSLALIGSVIGVLIARNISFKKIKEKEKKKE